MQYVIVVYICQANSSKVREKKANQVIFYRPCCSAPHTVLPKFIVAFAVMCLVFHLDFNTAPCASAHPSSEK